MAQAPRRELRCACGAETFAVRLDPGEQVGLLSCTAAQHHSLLLDSRDYWGSVIQAGKPKPARCRCKGTSFRVALDYGLRDGGAVEHVGVSLECASCQKVQHVARFEIDYEPTDSLLTRPLDPIELPWLKAKQVCITGLWTPSDLERVLTHAVTISGSIAYLEQGRAAPQRCELSQLLAAVHRPGYASFRIYLATAPQRFPENTRDCWKELPVVRTGAPTRIQYSSGLGLLHYVEYAEQTLRGAEVVAQPRAFLDYAGSLRAWLKSSFVSERGRHTADAPDEWQRLKRGILR